MGINMKKMKRNWLDQITAFCIQLRLKCHKDMISGQIEKDLSFMNPGKEKKQLAYEYYRDKIKLFMMLLAAGISIMILAAVMQYKAPLIVEQSRILRNESGAGKKNVSLSAELSKEQYIMDIEIEERKLSLEEKEIMFEEAFGALPSLILGNNIALDHVCYPLKLVSQIEGYPVTIRWESSRYDLLLDDGSYGSEKVLPRGEKITLYASLYYGDEKREKGIVITLFPQAFSDYEQTKRKLEEKIQSGQEETKSDWYFELPREIEGQTIQWRENKVSILMVFSILFCFTIVAVMKGKDRDIHKKYLMRNKSFLMEYPEFVSKLQLLTGSGMTIRGAFEKVGNDYRKKKREGGEMKYVYEEVLLTIRKMEGGLEEGKGYDFFGNRCGIQSYKKLSALLIQNLKKGSDGLHRALENEVRIAFEERKQNARRLGEEAGTKLLLPMMMQLGVVMIIIMVPAYLSFGGI